MLSTRAYLESCKTSMMKLFLRKWLTTFISIMDIWQGLYSLKLPSYRNQSIDLQKKSVDWFLYVLTFVFNELKTPPEYVLSKQSKQLRKLTLFFPMFPFDPPENIRKVWSKGQKVTLARKWLRLDQLSSFIISFIVLLSMLML